MLIIVLKTSIIGFFYYKIYGVKYVLLYNLKQQIRIMTHIDPNHCRCFSIDNTYNDEFKKHLEEHGFKNTPFQNIDNFVFGRILYLNEHLQIHVKIDFKGDIESELEYRPDYPIEHLCNGSCSAHTELKKILKEMKIPYSAKTPPSTCLQRTFHRPKFPIHAAILLAIPTSMLSVALIHYGITKSRKKDSYI